jgi:hypothetical protein
VSETPPLPGLRILTAGLFDYAGTFPPAALAFDEALAMAASFPGRLLRPWLRAADLVVTTGQLADLLPERLRAAGFPDGRTIDWAVLGPALKLDGPAAVHRDLLAWLDSQGASALPQRVVSYEVRVELSPADTGWLNEALVGLTQGLAPSGIRLVIEPDWSPEAWLEGAEVVAGVLAGMPEPRPVLKVRGSGPKAIDVRALAHVVGFVVRYGLGFKATAGLHHPIRDARWGNDLGFLSLAAGLRLRQALGEDAFPEEALLSCFAQEGRASLEAFDLRRGLAWRDWSLDTATLEAVVARQPFAIGSCSLDEPDEDLAEFFGGP